jgi:hypothetical protein
LGNEESKPPSSSFYRKVIRTTNGRLINLTPVLPEQWEIVQVRLDAIANDRIMLTIIKLDGDIKDAQATATNESDKQDASTTR